MTIAKHRSHVSTRCRCSCVVFAENGGCKGIGSGGSMKKKAAPSSTPLAPGLNAGHAKGRTFTMIRTSAIDGNSSQPLRLWPPPRNHAGTPATLLDALLHRGPRIWLELLDLGFSHAAHMLSDDIEAKDVYIASNCVRRDLLARSTNRVNVAKSGESVRGAEYLTCIEATDRLTMLRIEREDGR